MIYQPSILKSLNNTGRVIASPELLENSGNFSVCRSSEGVYQLQENRMRPVDVSKLLFCVVLRTL